MYNQEGQDQAVHNIINLTQRRKCYKKAIVKQARQRISSKQATSKNRERQRCDKHVLLQESAVETFTMDGGNELGPWMALKIDT